MTDLELIFSMLGEASTTEIARKKDARGLNENRRAAKEGGSVAGNARKELEAKTGAAVISHLHPHKKRLAVSSSGAGLALAQDCRLGDEPSHACGSGVCGVADGHRSQKPGCRADRTFRQGHTMRER
jgi:hypothetical protein